jgi:hypothetical protein
MAAWPACDCKSGLNASAIAGVYLMAFYILLQPHSIHWDLQFEVKSFPLSIWAGSADWNLFSFLVVS